jgi:hypothetical protein
VKPKSLLKNGNVMAIIAISYLLSYAVDDVNEIYVG